MLISAFVFGGVPEKAVKKAFADADIYVSPSLLKEYRDVPMSLASEGKIDAVQLEGLISGIASFVTNAKIVYPQKRMSVCRDPKDNMLLDCCLAARADFLVTGDRDMLDITALPFELKILTPKKFTTEV